jgi:hypothetical protein
MSSSYFGLQCPNLSRIVYYPRLNLSRFSAVASAIVNASEEWCLLGCYAVWLL